MIRALVKTGWRLSALAVLLAGCTGGHGRVHLGAAEPEAAATGKVWRFAVAGDSRDCGDVVMPAIAHSALRHQVAFYWHLGDFRKMSEVDADMAQQYQNNLRLQDYRRDAWGDFLAHQIAPFGLTPVYLGIGNHELYENGDASRSRSDYLAQFAYWTDAPALHSQRLDDDPAAQISKTYYHWKQGGVDLIYLDNADENGFDAPQLQWFERVLAKDVADPRVRAAVVGMHRALPNSLACGHSMNGNKGHERPDSITSGRQAYRDLLTWQRTSGKPVYILASHSHFFMERTFETPYWQSRGVLPGWIVGTAGAHRYPLPDDLPVGIAAKTFVSGYLLGTVHADGQIQFEFQELNESDVPAEVSARFGERFVHTCFAENRETGAPAPLADSCHDR